jgi:hypothetical protein
MTDRRMLLLVNGPNLNLLGTPSVSSHPSMEPGPQSWQMSHSTIVTMPEATSRASRVRVAATSM